MKNCKGCYTYNSTHCQLYSAVGELCICGTCIIKVMCKERCKTLTKFYRQRGILSFSKISGYALRYDREKVDDVSKKIKISRRSK